MAGPAVIGPGGREPSPRPLLRTMVGRVLRRIRLEQGRTLADVSRAARVSMPYLSEVERGRKEASSEVLAAVCDALQIELADMLGMVGSDLAVDRGRRARIIRLEAIRLERFGGSHGEAVPGRAPSLGHRPGDAQCLLAA
jgi:transcriptional regulator with XRE-family HTH domain